MSGERPRIGCGAGVGAGVGVGSGSGTGVGSGVGAGVGSGVGAAVGSGVGVGFVEGSGVWAGSVLLLGFAASCVTAALGRVPLVVLSEVDAGRAGTVAMVPIKAAHRTAPFANPRNPRFAKNSCSGLTGAAITANIIAIMLVIEGKNASATNAIKATSVHKRIFFSGFIFMILFSFSLDRAGLFRHCEGG